MEKQKKINYALLRIFAAIFIAVNLLTFLFIYHAGKLEIERRMDERSNKTEALFAGVMDNYEHSFRLFVELLKNEIQNNPAPDDIWDFLKRIDAPMLEIEGETFDGLYMYYQGRYLYSWNTPYSQYEETGYVATERPWYQDAANGDGEIVFTPPYMSYANHYILTTLSQMQPDGETVFAYDIKMGDIQELVLEQELSQDEQIIIYDKNGTVIGSTDPEYLGGSFSASIEAVEQAVLEAEKEVAAFGGRDSEQLTKLNEQLVSAAAFRDFRNDFEDELEQLRSNEAETVRVSMNGKQYFAMLSGRSGYHFLVLTPVTAMLGATLGSWLVPLLIVELFLIYILGRMGRELKNRELKKAYIELGQTQRRLEIALNVAQKAAAIDELTGLMNLKSFQTATEELLNNMHTDECGIFLMLDGDRFKQVNDNYGHSTGDEVIQLCAHMIIGRIRLVDLASRLHGDEFAIFVSNTSDYAVAKGIMEDINRSIELEAKKRKLPVITMSAGAVVGKKGDAYSVLAKQADKALYRAKETHNGGFASYDSSEKD